MSKQHQGVKIIHGSQGFIQVKRLALKAGNVSNEDRMNRFAHSSSNLVVGGLKSIVLGYYQDDEMVIAIGLMESPSSEGTYDIAFFDSIVTDHEQADRITDKLLLVASEWAIGETTGVGTRPILRIVVGIDKVGMFIERSFIRAPIAVIVHGKEKREMSIEAGVLVKALKEREQALARQVANV